LLIHKQITLQLYAILPALNFIVLQLFITLRRLWPGLEPPNSRSATCDC